MIMKRKFTLILLFLAFTTFVYSQTVSKYAGTPRTTTTGLNHGFDKDASFFGYPWGIAFDSKGNLWISNYGGPEDLNDPTSSEVGHTVGLIEKNTGLYYNRVGTWGQPCGKDGNGIGANNSKLANPAGICVGPNDEIYVADEWNHCIRKISPFTTLANVQSINVYAGKVTNTTQQCWTVHPGHADGAANVAQFNYPTGVTIDQSGNLYVADAGNHVIRKIDVNGNVTTIAGQVGVAGNADNNDPLKATFNYPKGIFYDQSDNSIYIAEFGNAQLRKIAANGKVTTLIETNDFPFPWAPTDVVFDSKGKGYLSNYARILSFKNNNIAVFAGTNNGVNDTGYVNGFATDARFFEVRQMELDPNDDEIVYAADMGNHVIRKMRICQWYNVDMTTTTPNVCLQDDIDATAPAGYQDYTWYKNGTEIGTGTSINLTSGNKASSFKLVLKVTNGDLCPGYDTVSMSFYKESYTITPASTTFCPGGNTDIVGPNGLDYYTWKKDGVLFDEGANKQTINVTQAGAYQLEGKKGVCEGTSNTVNITIGDLKPVIFIVSGDTNLCENDQLVIETGNFDTYQWKKDGVNLATTKRITITKAGVYSVYCTKGTCTGSSYDMTVTIISAPPKPTVTNQGDTLLISSSTTNNQWYRNGVLLPGAVAQNYNQHNQDITRLRFITTMVVNLFLILLALKSQ